MELFAFHDELVALLCAHQKDSHFVFLRIDIVQDAELARAQFVLCERILAELLYGFRGLFRLIGQTTMDGGFDGSLILRRQIIQVSLGLLGDGYFERHQRTSSCNSLKRTSIAGPE